jgi:cell pole-organizing protein PopZ
MTATNAPSYATELSAEQKAHEPSMEDILASIRRMIADDDALPLSRRARAAARSRIATPDEVEATAPQKAPADAFLSLVHRLGHESDGPAPEVLPSPPPEAVVASAPEAMTPDDTRQETKLDLAPPSAAPVAPTLKLRDFALKNFMARPAQERAALAEPATPSESLAASPAASELRPSLGEAEARVEPVVEPALASPGASVVMLSPRPSHAAEIRLKIAPLTFRAPAFAATPAPSAALSPVPEPVAESQPTPAPPIPAPAEAALLSSASDAKIGASFEALAESLLARDKDLVERAARDMLRPMLKSWLDDNLPSLVERLVRAEIERVARGRG